MLLIIFSFLAGLVTILSPCILPVLPAILASGADKGRLKPLGTAIGLMVSFTFFTLFASWIVSRLGLAADTLRWVAVILLFLFGLMMLFPKAGEVFSRWLSGLSIVGQKLESKSRRISSGWGSGFILGCALGLVWTPCAGPVLASIITLAATREVTAQIFAMTLAYSVGAAIPLLVVAYGVQKLSIGPWLDKIKKVFGALLIVTSGLLAFNVASLLQQYSATYFPPIAIENHPAILSKLSEMQGMPLKTFSEAPDFKEIASWINSEPLNLPIKGHVVLIDFWTYSCINCLRTLPYLKEWYQKYKDQGLIVVGVHSPEFEFEKNLDNVKAAVKRLSIAYPVALDNHFATWQAYNNLYWPAHYLIDQEGKIRYTHFGEGAYMETENAIRNLLHLPMLSEKEKKGPSSPLTPETYLGYARAESYVETIHPDQVHTYSYDMPLSLNQVALKGDFIVEKEKVTAQKKASLQLKFLAKEVYLVLSGPTGAKVLSQLDSEPPNEITLDGQRLYTVAKSDYGSHLLTLTLSPGISAYAFTFGE